MRNVGEQIEDAEDERQGDIVQADLDREHFEAGRLLGALLTMTHRERYAEETDAEMEAGQ